MIITVAIEHRFGRTPDGCIWTKGLYPFSFWQRYLEVFDNVVVVARIEELLSPGGEWVRADGPGVAFHPIPHYVGPAQFALNYRRIRQQIRRIPVENSAFILRVPGVVGTLLWKRLLRLRIPYAVEVVGDPFDVFSPDAFSHPGRPYFRWKFTRDMRLQCARASCAAYVTRSALQARYPARGSAFSTHYSSVELREDAFRMAPRQWVSVPRPVRLLTVGSLEHGQKGTDIAIRAVAQCIQRGLQVCLTVVGDGRCRPEFEGLARDLDIAHCVRFLGYVPFGSAVREQFESADVFVLPSRQEGLPRAMLEAMAWGLPCIGSDVGGIPEILARSDIVVPNTAESLQAVISNMVASPVGLSERSARNWAVAREYAFAILQDRRRAFYSTVISSRRVV